jgi:hypothetical protein
VLQFSPVDDGEEPQLSAGELHDDIDVWRRSDYDYVNDRLDRSDEPDLAARNADRG